MKTSSAVSLAALVAVASAVPFNSLEMDSSGKASRAFTSLDETSASPAKLLITNSGHIYLADYDSSSETITTRLDQTVSGTPSWTAFIAPDLLYAVDEDSSTTRIFRVDTQANTIAEGATAEGSSGIVHLEFNHERTRMVGAGYGSGKIDIWNIEDGGLSLIKTLVSDDPLGPGQNAAHPHESVLDPTGRFFATNDLGTDHILLIDSLDDKWEFASHVQVTPAGTGPRHGAFYPNNKGEQATNYFLVTEMGSQVITFELTYTDDNIEFNEIEHVSSYGPGRGPADPSTAAGGELVISGDNIYVSNRLTGNATDSLARFTVVKDPSSGRVSGVQFAEDVSSGGILPRMFSISEDGSDLFVGNQAGDQGLVVVGLGADGKLDSGPKASVTNTAFGTEPTTGPQFVKQIA